MQTKKKQIVASTAKTAKNNKKIAEENSDMLKKGSFNFSPHLEKKLKKMEDKKAGSLARAKNIFEELKTDDKSILSTEEKTNDRLFKRLKKSQYLKDKEFVKLITSVKDFETINKNNKNIVPLRLDYVEKQDIDRSTCYGIDRPFHLVHADIANLELLGKSVTHPKYCLLVVDMFLLKIYTYPMRSRRNSAKKLNKFYIDVAKRRNNKRMCLQADQEFQQNQI